ncbi:c-type cytochrome [Arenicella xantha]|uniref:Cytochrome c556 n=1 Tax=Arenicella xantha TaxID=644221 RepID=A0A395JN07_9GAMM|nr:cytochrome c [Arenicella xantha]RBP51197.1 cytochrome c556 [Arenicella xantha]
MHVLIRSLVVTALTLSFSSIGFAQDKQPTPEERAYKFRTSLFQTFAWKLGQLAQAKGRDDQPAFSQHAKDLAYLSTLIEEGFAIDNSIPEGSSAKAEIWEDFADFKDKASNLTTLSQGLTDADAMAGFDPRDFGSKACGTCHREYKVKD